MGRRLAEATKACRTRRTCGETGLCFFLVLAEVAVFRLVVVFFVAGARFGDAFLTEEGDELDWAAAGGKKPSQGRKNVPAKTTTAKRRTQTPT